MQFCFHAACWQIRVRDEFSRDLNARGPLEPLTTLIIASIEGAVVLARAERSVAPLERVADELERVITAALD